MSQSLGNSIADSLRLSLRYSEVLLKDVPEETFGKFAANDGGVIESNHGAFVFGHLSLYASEVLKHLGQDVPQIPDGFAENFSKDCKCVDASAADLPSMDAITKFYFDSWNVAMEKLREADDELLQQPNPSESMGKRFPTIGSMLNFYSSGHMMMHLGQFSAWRRMHGMGAA